MSSFSGSGESQELAIPGTGELVRLEDAISCAQALDALRKHEQDVREAKTILQRAIFEVAKQRGVRSITLPDGRRADVKGDIEIVYDAEAIERGLREAGMPEDRISEIIEETVSYRVRVVEAKKAAAANPEYAAVIEAGKNEVPTRPSVTIRRR
jgi:hypothetical protein